MRTWGFLLLLAVAAKATFVAELDSVKGSQLKRIVKTACKTCGTDTGRVDMWQPDSIELEEIADEAIYRQVHVRGDVELDAHLAAEGLKFVRVHDDVEKAAHVEKQRALKRWARGIPNLHLKANSTQQDDFYDDYHQYPDYQSKMQSLAAQYPSVAFSAVGITYNGQQIHALRFGTTNNAGNHTVYIQCGIHSREWISPITCLYVTQKLLEQQAAGDAEINAILSNTDVWIIPVLNRDGYDFTWSDNRMWRKNRQPNAGSTAFGTDLNRNFDSGYAVCGASTNPASDTYRGAYVWSGPEAAVVRDFFTQRQGEGRHILGALDIHSYGPEVLRPLGWSGDDLPNEQQEYGRAEDMIAAIQATTGMVYANKRSWDNSCIGGTAKDWFWQVTTTASGFTLELRGTPGGFILPPDQIVPSGEEIYAAVVVYMKDLLYMN